ncbi:hypothetical protein NKH10_04480 [Mesorhizobium sp. M1340]|uniref:SecDF P1 head subdomain-containing protein n=1 Tax=unclassified Mesorhizobium TaxID=325217 RepID=UPI003337D407
MLCRLIAGLAIVLLACGPGKAQPLTLAIAKASVVRDPAPGQVALSRELTPDGRKAFAEFTSANVGNTIDLSIDGSVVMSPRLVEPILGGRLMVSGNFVQGELTRIANRISSGDAKVTVDVTAE